MSQQVSLLISDWSKVHIIESFENLFIFGNMTLSQTTSSDFPMKKQRTMKNLLSLVAPS